MIFRDRLEYLIKHNRIAQWGYRTILGSVIRFAGLFVKQDPKLIIFLSLMGKKFNDSPKAIYNYMLSNDKYKDYKMIWAFQSPKDFPGIPSVKVDSIRFFYYALKAGYWISSTQFERGLTYKNNKTKYMYTMHGTAIKLAGNDCPGRKDFNFKTVNLLCVQSDFDKYVFQKSFNASKDCFLESGRPCNDILWHVTPQMQQETKKRLGLPEDKKIILYAPTWRESQNGGQSYDITPPIDIQLWEKRLKDKYIILFRSHHITTKVLKIQFGSIFKDFSDYPEINDLFIVSDIPITDYSSVMVDYAILERPILFFTYDYTDYLKERGTYFDLSKELPNKLCYKEEEILEMIENIDFEEQKSKTKKFKMRFDQYGGNGTQMAVEALFGTK